MYSRVDLNHLGGYTNDTATYWLNNKGKLVESTCIVFRIPEEKINQLNVITPCNYNNISLQTITFKIGELHFDTTQFDEMFICLDETIIYRGEYKSIIPTKAPRVAYKNNEHLSVIFRKMDKLFWFVNVYENHSFGEEVKSVLLNFPKKITEWFYFEVIRNPNE